ncbi:DUF4214 domain-containing protein, partial [Serratia marcescens]
SAAELSSLLSLGSLPVILSSVINNVLNYSGFDATQLAAQDSFTNTINTILYPSVNAAAAPGAADVQGLFYVFGMGTTTDALNTYGAAIASGAQTVSDVAAAIISSRTYLSGISNSDFVARLFTNGYQRSPTQTELNQYLSELSSGTTRAQVALEVIASLKGTVASSDAAAQAHFNGALTVYSPGQLAGLAYQEQVSSIYLAVPGRDIDASGVDPYSKSLAAGQTFNSLISTLLASSEFQRKGAQLTGNDFVQHVYTAVHGTAATAAQLAQYSGLANKSLIVSAIINDLRTSVATDNATVTQQHAFEYDIGSSLLYKTAATLSVTSGGGNATGTVNTGASHTLSNAETAVLANAVLNANAASLVNLKFADHLANLTINGT